MKMNSTRLPKFNFKNSLGINKEYIQKELFKSINKNKKMSGNSRQTRNSRKGKPEIFLNTSTNPNDQKKPGQNYLLLNKYNTTTESEKKTNSLPHRSPHTQPNEKTPIEKYPNKKLNTPVAPKKETKETKTFTLFNFPEIIDHPADAQIPYEYFNDFLETFCMEEKTLEFKIQPNFMNQQSEINNRMRAVVVNWIIEVHNRFKLLPDTLFLSVIIFDRYMSLVKNIKKKKLQLVGVTSLLLGCKFEEIFSPEVRDFVCILDRAYEREDLMDQENEMMKNLKFEVTFPSSLKYYEILRLELDLNKESYHLGKFLLEITLIDAKFSNYSQAIIASAVCYMLMKIYEENLDKFFECVRIPIEAIKNCVIDICFLVDNIENSNYQSIIKKHSAMIKKFKSVLKI